MQEPSTGESSSSSNEGSSWPADRSWAPTPGPVSKVDILNTFLSHGGYEPIKGQLLKPLDECISSTKWLYKRKAREVINLSLSCLAPEQEEEILKEVMKADKHDVRSTSTELTAIIKCYKDTKSWFTWRQLLSLRADGRTKEQLLVRHIMTEVYWKKTLIAIVK